MGQDSFNPAEDIKDEDFSFVHPKYLPNTKFIKTKPLKLMDFLIETVEKFQEHYGFTDYKFGVLFYNRPDFINKLKNEKTTMKIDIVQRCFDDMFYYDEFTSKSNGSKKLFFRRHPFNIKENLIKNINLFCARHYISERQFSEFLFNSDSIILNFKLENKDFLCTTVDYIFLTIHDIDKGLLKRMGKVYEEWKSSERGNYTA